LDKIEKIINKKWEELRKYKNVLNIRKGTKWTGGKDTGIPCIVFYVKKKVKRISKKHKIPEEINGIKTDVIELRTKDFKIGKTKASKLPPEIQKRIAGGVRKDGED